MAIALTQVNVNSIVLTDHLINKGWELAKTYGYEASILKLYFSRAVMNLWTPQTGQVVEVWKGFTTPTDEQVFKGFVENYTTESAYVTVVCKDELQKLVNAQVNNTFNKDVPGDPLYPDGKISDLIIDLITDYGGLNADTSSVTDSGTTYTLSKYPCKFISVFYALTQLCQAIGYSLYYNPVDDKVYAQPKNVTVNPEVLTVGSNVVVVPKWEYDQSEMINDLTVKGAQQYVETSELKSGNASDVTFTLTPPNGTIPDTVTVYYGAATNFSTTAPTQSQLKIGGVSNVSSGNDYTIDRINNTITFTTFTPASGTNNILVIYTYPVPIPVHFKDDVSITTYGLYAKTVNLQDVSDLEDAENRGRNIINVYKNPFQFADITVWDPAITNTFEAGSSIQVVDNVNRPVVNDLFNIYKVVESYPKLTTELSIGQKPFDELDYNTNIATRVQKLEEVFSGEDGLNTEIRELTTRFTIIPYSLQYDVELANDSFILGHSINGVLRVGTESFIIDDFETHGNWSQSAGSVSLTIAADTDSDHYWVGSQGTKVTFTPSGEFLADDFSDNEYTSNPTWTVSAGSWSAATGKLVSSSSAAAISTPVTITNQTDLYFEEDVIVTNPQPNHVVISQVYGGGGGTGATYTHDFIELYNPTSSAVNLSTWSVQYATASGTGWQRTNLTGIIPAHGYYLVKQASGGVSGSALPTPDDTGTIGMNTNNGKVALRNNQNTITLGTSCPIPVDATIIDFVGYGTANCFEGTGATGALSTSTSAKRPAGNLDTDDNSVDFSVGTPSARNSSTVEDPVGMIFGLGTQTTDTNGSNNGYRVYVTTDGTVTLARMDSGVATTVVTATTTITSGASYNLKAERISGTWTLYKDDVSIGTPAVDSTYDDFSYYHIRTLTQVGTNSTDNVYVEGLGGGTTAAMQNTSVSVNMSTVTGVSSGTPSTGTAGVWAYIDDASTVTSISLRLGSSSSDYKEYAGLNYRYWVGRSGSFSLTNTSKTLVLFDLTNPSATSGSINWTAIDYVQLRWETTGSDTITFDYLTCSISDDLSMNGLGDRITQESTTTVTY